jgi:hypothetical protein
VKAMGTGKLRWEIPSPFLLFRISSKPTFKNGFAIFIIGTYQTAIF